MMNRQINCSKAIELLESKIATGQLEIAESELIKELNNLQPINENKSKDIDQDTTLLEAIYNNIGKSLED